MKKIIKPPILDRVRSAARALRGQPSRCLNLSVGVEVKHCNDCKRKDCSSCGVKEKLKELLSLPNCQDCAQAHHNACGFCPKIGEQVRINCPLYVAKE